MSTSVTLTENLPGRNLIVETAFCNPAVPGFAPDPSAIFVNGTYFLVTSSFHVFPGIPVYATQDLRSWTHIGNAVNRTSQVDLSKATAHSFPLDTGHTMVASGGLWAPTIREHKGRFYIACTNCTRGGEAFNYSNFYIYTDDIWSGQWSDPIFVDFKGIDPSLFFDDDDRVYFQAAWELTRESQPSCMIKQVEIEIESGKVLSEMRDIWQGDAKYDTEGPHIYKKDGYYYLLVAEGGTFENHMLSIGRSRDIWGPYESYEKNPIMTAKGKDEYIQNAGHGEIFQGADGAWWALVLAVRNEAGERCPMGRETFLTPVDWPTGEWPKVHQPRMAFGRAVGYQRQVRDVSARLAIASKDPRIGDVYIRNPNAADYTFGPAGSITLLPRQLTPSSFDNSPTFVGKRQRHIDFIAYVHLTLPSGLSRGIKAGLCVYKDNHRHIGIYYDSTAKIVCAYEEIKTSDRPVIRVDAATLTMASSVHFQIRGSTQKYDLLYRQEKQDTWTHLHSVDTAKLTARDFTGTLVGLHCNSIDDAAAQEMTFHGFEVSPEISPIL